MDYLSKDLNGLKKYYSKFKVELSKSEKRLEAYMEERKTELKDKHIYSPLENAKLNDTPIMEMAKIRKNGQEKLKEELLEEKKKKAKELGIPKKRKILFRLEMEINSRKNASKEPTN